MAEPKKQLIQLEKFTQQSKVVITEAQVLADEMRHSKVTLLHLYASFDAFITAEQVLMKTTGFKPYISTELAKKFMHLLEIDIRYNGSLVKRINDYKKDASEPNTAYLTAEFLRLLKFSEERATDKKVTLQILLHELFCTMRDV